MHSRKKEAGFTVQSQHLQSLPERGKNNPALYNCALNKNKKGNFLTYIAKLALQNRF